MVDTPKTWAVAEVVSAADMNAQVRDMLLATAPQKATQAGQMFYSTGVREIAALTPSGTSKQVPVWNPTSSTMNYEDYGGGGDESTPNDIRLSVEVPSTETYTLTDGMIVGVDTVNNLGVMKAYPSSTPGVLNDYYPPRGIMDNNGSITPGNSGDMIIYGPKAIVHSGWINSATAVGSEVYMVKQVPAGNPSNARWDISLNVPTVANTIYKQVGEVTQLITPASGLANVMWDFAGNEIQVPASSIRYDHVYSTVTNRTLSWTGSPDLVRVPASDGTALVIPDNQMWEVWVQDQWSSSNGFPFAYLGSFHTQLLTSRTSLGASSATKNLTSSHVNTGSYFLAFSFIYAYNTSATFTSVLYSGNPVAVYLGRDDDNRLYVGTNANPLIYRILIRSIGYYRN